MRDGDGRPGGGDSEVISIVDRLQRRRLARERERASAMHLREVELSLEREESGQRIKEADFDAQLAALGRLAPEEARVLRAQIRDARALQACLRGTPEAGFAEWSEVIAEAPDLADPYLVRGRWVMHTDPAAAMVDYDRAAALEPRNPAVYWRRGDCLLALGDPDRALANYRRALALGPPEIDLLQAIAKLLFARGEHAEAAATYGRAIALAPRYADFYLGRARALEALGDFDAALRDHARILELDPSRHDARFYRVICHQRAGHRDRALDEAQELVLCEPGDHHNHWILGKLLMDAGRFAEAAQSFSRALEITPDDVASHSHRGFAFWQAGESERALADFDRAIALAPDEPQHVFARTLVRAHDLPREEARAEVDALLAQHPDVVVLLEHRARMRTAEGDHAGALADLDRAVAGAPDDAELRVARALLYAGQSRLPEALDDAEAAAALAPESAVAHALCGVYRRHLDGEPVRVEADLDRAVALGPTDPSILNQRGLFLSDQGRHAAAIADFDRAIALAPLAPSLYYARAYARNRLDEEQMDKDDEWEEPEEATRERCLAAIADLERAQELGLRDEDVFMQLWASYNQMRDQEAELAVLDRGLEAFPDNRLFLIIRHSLRNLRGDREGAAADRARAEALGHRFDP